ncbi:MAG: aminopeptidase P family protein [Alkalispirochaeta sp.]
MSTIEKRLARLRSFMDSAGVAAVIIPSSDPHQSEYMPLHFQSRAYISGFHGSAGTVVVTRDRAGLWTDSRYYVAAEQVLPPHAIALHKSGMPGVMEYPEWLANNLSAGEQVGIDPRLIPVSQMRHIQHHLEPREITLQAIDDPFAEIWTDRPPLPANQVWPLPDTFAGESTTEKLRRLRAEMKHHGASSHVITSLDDIAWVLNLRGSDVAYNPVFLAYLIVTSDGATLFTEASRIRDDARQMLRAAQVKVLSYESFDGKLVDLSGPILIDPERLSWHAYATLTAAVRERPQPTSLMKARKNAVELNHIRDAMIRDGQAMVRFLAWIDRQEEASERLTEARAAEKLQVLREQDDRYISDSFNYISGWAANGAVVHYAHDPQNPAVFGTRGLYLIDSGGQYLDGTTDITRTITVGPPTAEEQEDFTLVLKGHIALARLHVPEGTAGRDIDVIARRDLWMHHRNYGHGTGHGVGFVLNVHEGPQKIAPGNSATPLQPGMVLSNEPGLYREGQYGIRIENLMAVERAGGESFGEFLSFETLTLCPIDLRLVDAGQLNDAEREWLNEYHRVVREELRSGLNDDDRAWLDHATRPV